MKKRRLPIIATSIASLLFLGSCAEELPAPDVEEYAHHYLVSFYVDNELYQTARVKEGETVGDIIEAPTKDDYNFVGWQTSDGVAFDLNATVINSSLDVYAKFELKSKPVTSEDEASLNVTDTKDPTKDYFLVIGWYGKTSKSGLDADLMKHFYLNVRVFLRAKGVSEDDLAKISVRQYGDADTDVAPMGKLINADGDVDILVGVGSNLSDADKGNVPSLELDGGIPMGGQTRYIARLTENETGKLLYDFIKTDIGLKMFDESFYLTEEDVNGGGEEPVINPWDDLSVTDTKDEAKDYSLVIGWWSRYVQENTMKHFYYNLRNYLLDEGVEENTINSITVREFDDAKIAGLVESVNAQGDLDLFFGGASNLDSDENFGSAVTINMEEGYTIDGKDSRVNALFDGENSLAVKVFEFMGTDEGVKLWDLSYLYESENIDEPLVTKDNIAESDLNVTDTKVDGKDYYLVIMWYGKTSTSGIDEALAKHFYHNVRAYLIDKGITQTQLDSISFRVTNGDKVANVAEDVAKDGDIDLLFGCGSTIGKALEDANVTIYERTNGTDELGNEVGFVINGKEKRNHCLLSENQVAKDLYDYVCTAEGHKMWDISYEYSAK